MPVHAVFDESELTAAYLEASSAEPFCPFGSSVHVRLDLSLFLKFRSKCRCSKSSSRVRWLHAASHSFWSMVVSPSGLAALKSVTYGALCDSVRPGGVVRVSLLPQIGTFTLAQSRRRFRRIRGSIRERHVCKNRRRSGGRKCNALHGHYLQNIISLHRKSPNSCGSTLIFRCGRVRNMRNQINCQSTCEVPSFRVRKLNGGA